MNKPSSKGFTLIELLVVIAIIGVLASMLMVGIIAAQRAARRAGVKSTLSSLMIALTAYNNEFADYPPGGTEIGTSGKMADNDPGSGKRESTWVDSKNPTADELQLRAVCWTYIRYDRNGNKIGTIDAFLAPGKVSMKDGVICDVWGTPLRYMPSGGKYDDTGLPAAGRVTGRKPVIWSLGDDKKQDPDNNNEDDNKNGRVDEVGELVDDLCSWNN